MKYFQFLVFLLSACFAVQTELQSQVTVAPQGDTSLVEILPGVRKLEFRKVDADTELQILAGNVRLRQGTVLFSCDSCVINNKSKVFEAFGNVHINDSDTANVYSNYLRYLMDRKIAYLTGNVRLDDGHGQLTTNELEYDVNTNIGIYKNGGKVVNKTTTLTSREGYYYSDIKDVYFKNNVELKDPKYYLKTDSLLYNTESETARFIAETFIRDSSGRTIETREGFYNLRTGVAEFGQNPVVRDKGMFATGREIRSDDSAGIVQIRGDAVVIDSTNNTTVIAGEIFLNRKTNAFLATIKPLMIIEQDEDSIYISADTLFSARLTDLYKNRDSIARQFMDSTAHPPGDSIYIDTGTVKPPGEDSLQTDSVTVVNPVVRDSATTDSVIYIRPQVRDSINTDTTIISEPPSADSMVIDSVTGITTNVRDSVIVDTLTGVTVLEMDEKDSTNRYFEAFRNVRIFSDSLQAVGDSVFYSFKDSVFRLFYNPVVWSDKNQVTGDTIRLYTKNKKAERLEVIENSMMVNELDPGIYNQVKASRMDGYFIDGNIDSVRARGLAESIYYIQDEDSAYTGINQASSDVLDIYFRNKELFKVVFRSAVKGTIWPIKQKSPEEMRLPGFQWLDHRRPKTKFELFE